MAPELQIQLEQHLREVHTSARLLRALSTTLKNEALLHTADLILRNQNAILAANLRDLNGARRRSHAFVDRLSLNEQRIHEMVEGLRQVAALDDPVGECLEARTLSSGLQVRRVRAPLGVILLIFESRPNVVLEAFSLAFKSGNAILLRGGRESIHTVSTLYGIMEQGLVESGIALPMFWGIRDPDRDLVRFLLKQRRWIDVVVPRGDTALIDFVVSESLIPIIKNDRGLCHVYVHDDADLSMAAQIVVNAKTQRPGVCNAMETLLVHEHVAERLLPELYEEMTRWDLEWRGCPATVKILRDRARVVAASDTDWDTEYLDLVVNCRVVKSLDEAILHIETHGSKHSEAIVTRDVAVARRFQAEVDAAAVFWNASTRFTDGFQFGLGGELGISTQKLHVRGPVGLKELTSARWIIDGAGHIRR